MLAASIHEHAGLGNQIWRYVSCRVFAEHKGYEWGVSHPGWRGPFLNMDWGKEVTLNVEQDEDFHPMKTSIIITKRNGFIMPQDSW